MFYIDTITGVSLMQNIQEKFQLKADYLRNVGIDCHKIKYIHLCMNAVAIVYKLF